MSQIVQLQSKVGKRGAAADADKQESPSPTLGRIREDLNALTGKKYWRSLEELADAREFQKLVEREFPENATEWNDPAGRRKFLKLMGASLALAGLTGCTRQPTEKIAPYVRQPEQITPGHPLYFATSMPLGGAAIGLLVESHEGRPTKVEGNGLHPAARVADDIIRSTNLNGEPRGATDIFSQASILSLYDPDRSQTLTHLGDISTWSAFLGEANKIRRALLLAQPGGQPAQGQADQQPGASDVEPATGHLAILTETVSSPTLAFQIMRLMREIPGTRWYMHEPAVGDGAREGARMAFGQPVNTVYRFDQADIVLSLDSDFLSCGPASVRYAADFAARRRLDQEHAQTIRLYAVESSVTNTGASADHRLPLKPTEVEAFARALAARVGVGVGQAPAGDAVSRHENFLNVLAEDLLAHRGRCVVVAGDYQPPQVHAIAHALNQALGAVGATVAYTDPTEGGVADNAVGTLAQLGQAIDAGQVYALLIIGGNPAYTAPADFNFADRMQNVKHRIHLSLYKDETSELCHWNLPEAHFLESWGDARAFDGTASIIQPLIAPIYTGKTAHEAVSAFTDNPERSSYDTVRDYWMRRFAGGGAAPVAPGISSPGAAARPQGGQAGGQATGQTTGQAGGSGQAGSQQTGPGQPFASSQPSTGAAAVPADDAPTPTPEFEAFWRRALHDGVIPNTAAQPRAGAAATAAALQAPPQPVTGGDLEIVFRPDPTIYDGRFANNAWLQELPKPITTLTWDNVAMLSPATAARLGIGGRVNDIATNNQGYTGGEFRVDLIELEYRGRLVTAPAWVQPGHPDDCVTVTLGYGRRVAGRVGTGNGFNAYLLRTSDSPWFGSGVVIRKTGDTYSLAAVQQHHLLDDQQIGVRDLVRSQKLSDFRGNPAHEENKPVAPGHEGTREHQGEHPSLYPKWEYSGYAWGMAIDLNACVGCSACVVACVAENNIPVVGKEQVLRGREMHWLRVDSYFKGDLHNPETYFQPVPCMHCETAPCEVVCPVAATVHSAEGLNDMVYNRCVGTRYCSNNCPYKVRRFNFLLYQDFYTASLKMMRNPDVSVRSRGVMEKCTYCVQRIQEGKIQSELRGDRVQDKEVITACAQACPTKAIVFGDTNDETSEVYKMKHNQRNYALLDELNTQPRTTYLGAIRNPNPRLEKA